VFDLAVVEPLGQVGRNAAGTAQSERPHTVGPDQQVRERVAAKGTVNLSDRVSRIDVTGKVVKKFVAAPHCRLWPRSGISRSWKLGGSDVLAMEVEEVIGLVVG
jgi:hypothetical protein